MALLKLNASWICSADSLVTAGQACAATGTFRRATSGVVVQCTNGFWQSGGLQTTIATANVTANGGFVTSTATCPTGSTLIGGGYALLSRSSGGAGLDSESPAVSAPNGNGWAVQTGQTNGAGTVFQARALCSY